MALALLLRVQETTPASPKAIRRLLAGSDRSRGTIVERNLFATE
jgi:hypothetical protein